MGRSGRGRLPALDGLRGLCASMVMLYHLPSAGLIGSSPFVRQSFLFVDFFFVLSGLVISRGFAQALADGMTVRDFMARRLWRVYPLHALVLAGFLLMNLLGAALGARHGAHGAFDPPDDLPSFAVNLLFLQNLVGPSGLYWNVPAWSVAAESWTYLLFALAATRLPRGLPALAIGLAVLVPLGFWIGGQRHISGFHLWATPRAIYGFAAGYLLHRLLAAIERQPRALPAAAATAAEVAAVVVAVAFVVRAGPTSWSLAAPFVFAAGILPFALGRGAVSRLLGLRPLVTLGDWSYAIYIGHFFVEFRLLKPLYARLLGPDWAERPHVADLATVAAVLAVLVVAWLLHRTVERPLLDRAARRRRRHAATGRVAAAMPAA